MPDLPVPTTEVRPLPRREAALHKGLAGRVTLFAGSRSMSGAAALAGIGALRGGAGLVRIFTPLSAQPLVAGHEPCYMVAPLPENPDGFVAEIPGGQLSSLVVGQHVVAIGPGLGNTVEVALLVSRCIEVTSVPLVIDADGLNVYAASGLAPAGGAHQLILTPHPGEMGRLLEAAGLDATFADDDDSRLAAAHRLAAHINGTVLLKGHRTVVCTPERAYLNTTGNPGMATGGTGDVLTGLIAALIAQGLGGFDGARLAALVHGLAGDRAAAEIGPVGLLARDLAERIPAALADVCGWES